MANSIIAPKVFAKETIRLLDKENIFLAHTNREYEGELTKSGDAVRVQTLPTLTFTASTITGAGDMAGSEVGTWPWGAIAASDFTITLENLIVDKYSEKLVTLTKHQIKQSNLSLEEKVAGRFAEGLGTLLDGQVVSQILTTQIADIPAANKITEAGARTVDNIYTYILAQRAQLKKQHVKVKNLRLFVGNDTESLLLEAGYTKGSDLGDNMFKNGYIATVAGVPVYTSTELDASDEMIMMAEGSVNAVLQMVDTDAADGTNGSYTNVWSTAIWGMKIFGENAKAICVSTPV